MEVLLACKAVLGHGTKNADMRELLAIREGVLMARDIGCITFCMEGDSLGVIDRIIDRRPDYSHNGSILLDVYTFAL